MLRAFDIIGTRGENLYLRPIVMSLAIKLQYN